MKKKLDEMFVELFAQLDDAGKEKVRELIIKLKEEQDEE